MRRGREAAIETERKRGYKIGPGRVNLIPLRFRASPGNEARLPRQNPGGSWTSQRTVIEVELEIGNRRSLRSEFNQIAICESLP